MTQEEIAKIVAENAALKAEKAAIEAAANAHIVKGTFTVKVKREGKEVQEKYKFAENQHRIWSPSGNLVPTELVIKLANGETLEAAEVTDKNNMSEFINDKFKDNGKAIALLTDFAQRETPLLVKQ